MMTPSFWTSRGPLVQLLRPFSLLYTLGKKCPRSAAVRLDVPVICIGNATAGGAGKTPTALAVGQFFKDKGINAFFLSRGYGGSLPGPVRVDPENHTANEVGDEPLLLARLLPTVVAKDRVAGGRNAVAQGAEVIIMDDGFQNPSLVKDLSLLVIDSDYGFGNGYLLPAGPLREPARKAIARADASVIIGSGDNTPELHLSMKQLRAKLEPSDAGKMLAGKAVFAFCGIARPQKFFATLEELGAHVVGRQGFPDHAPYSENVLQRLVARAKEHNAILVTTAKDAARLSASQRNVVTVLDVDLVFDNPLELAALLEGTLA